MGRFNRPNLEFIVDRVKASRTLRLNTEYGNGVSIDKWRPPTKQLQRWHPHKVDLLRRNCVYVVTRIQGKRQGYEDDWRQVERVMRDLGIPSGFSISSSWLHMRFRYDHLVEREGVVYLEENRVAVPKVGCWYGVYESEHEAFRQRVLNAEP